MPSKITSPIKSPLAAQKEEAVMEQRLQESLGPDLGETRLQEDVDVVRRQEVADGPKIAEVVQVHREMSHGHLEASQNMMERMKT